MSRFPEIMKAGGDDDHESTEVRVQLQGSAMVLQNQMLVISSHFTKVVLHQSNSLHSAQNSITYMQKVDQLNSDLVYEGHTCLHYA